MLFNNNSQAFKTQSINYQELMNKFVQCQISDQKEVEEKKCVCSTFKNLANDCKVCVDCGVLHEKIEDTLLENRQLIRIQNAKNYLKIDRDIQKFMNWESFKDRVFESINTNQKLDSSKVPIPKQIIEQAFQDLKELCENQSIKGKNPERVLIHCIMKLCDQNGILTNTKYIQKLVGLQGVKIYQGARIYQEFELQKLQQEKFQLQSKIVQIVPIDYFHKNFVPTDAEKQLVETLIKIIDEHHLFMEAITKTKYKRIASILIVLRLQKDGHLDESIHSKHTKNKIKASVCWKCSIYALQQINADTRFLKDTAKTLLIVKEYIQDCTGMNWDWLQSV